MDGELADHICGHGTSADLYPAAELPRIAKARGAMTVKVNLEDTPATALYQERVRCTAAITVAPHAAPPP